MTMSSNICLCVLIGLPGSGKSTFARDLIVSPLRKIVFSYDDIPLDRTVNYKSYRQQARTMLELIVQDELEKRSDLVIIVDDNMIYRSMRYEIFCIARKLNLGFCQIHLKTDLELCIARNTDRGRSDVDEEMIRNQSGKLEHPGNSNSIMDKYFLEILNNLWKPEEVLELITGAMNNPIIHRPEVKNTSQEQSNVHKMDLVLRKHIGNIINQEECPERKKSIALELNNRRQELLQDIRNGNLIFQEPFLGVIDYM